MNTNYDRIAAAIEYIQTHFKAQPDLEEVAQHIALSPYHFQRLFSTWAGTSPKKFLQYLSLNYAKELLHNNSSLLNTALDTGLSGPGRLHDLFVTIEGMTPGEYKQGGRNLMIRYSFAPTPFGDVLVAATAKGLCYMAFFEDQTQAVADLHQQFPNACYQEATDAMQQNVLSIFNQEQGDIEKIKLHLKGSAFQLKVWEALLKIPPGRLVSYGRIAAYLNLPQSARAVGNAVAANPVAFLIPCHRVIQSSGVLGGYHWGQTRKRAMIGWEKVRLEQQTHE